MVRKIKSERYTEEACKGYLTYPDDPKIRGMLLKEAYNTDYIICFGKKEVIAANLPKDLVNDIVKRGGKITTRKRMVSTGRTKVFNICVEIVREINAIQIRIKGRDVFEIQEKMNNIEKNLNSYGYRPKKCVWDRNTLIKNH